MAERLVSEPALLDNGNLVVPQRVEEEDGTIGDRFIEITPEHPDYDDWLKFVQ